MMCYSSSKSPKKQNLAMPHARALGGTHLSADRKSSMLNVAVWLCGL